MSSTVRPATSGSTNAGHDSGEKIRRAAGGGFGDAAEDPRTPQRQRARADRAAHEFVIGPDEEIEILVHLARVVGAIAIEWIGGVGAERGDVRMCRRGLADAAQGRKRSAKRASYGASPTRQSR